MMLTATLSEYTVPMQRRATVWAEMERPDGTSKVLKMKEEDPGRFTAATVETVAGLYRFRVRAIGLTFRERQFTREQTLTAVIGRFGESSGVSELCRLLECLARGKVIQPGTVDDWKALAECLCRRVRAG